jgi:hypothetical protein
MGFIASAAAVDLSVGTNSREHNVLAGYWSFSFPVDTRMWGGHGEGAQQAGAGSGRVDGWNQYGRALACSDEMNGGLQNTRRRRKEEEDKKNNAAGIGR